jgi:hypothetical protein
VERRGSNDERLTLLLVAGDLAIALAAFAAAFLIRIWVPLPLTQSLLPPERAGLLHPSLTVVLATQVPLIYLFGLACGAADPSSRRAAAAPACALRAPMRRRLRRPPVRVRVG